MDVFVNHSKASLSSSSSKTNCPGLSLLELVMFFVHGIDFK
jgi:hypothetical protein